MPDSFMPAYSQATQPDPLALKTASSLMSDHRPNVVSEPFVTVIDDAISFELSGTYTNGCRYEVSIIPDDPTKFIRGWLCEGDTALADKGPMLDSDHPNYPVCYPEGPIVPIFFSFIRDPLTPHNCKIYVNVRETF